MKTEIRQEIWSYFSRRADVMGWQWTKDYMDGMAAVAGLDMKRAAELMANAAVAFQARQTFRNDWHLLRLEGLHFFLQLTTGEVDVKRPE